MAQQVISFLPTKAVEDTVVNFYYSRDDYSIDEAIDEITKYLTEQFTLHKSDIRLQGDWTVVPEVKRKFKITRVYNLFEGDNSFEKF